MSVRRLADASVQPASFAFNKANSASARKWIAKYPKGREQSAIIPLLMLAQEQEGWVTKAAIESICEMLGMPYIRGLEVATFYTQYQLKPVGTRAHVQVCGTTPCMLRGSEELMDVCRSKIHHDQFHTNEAGTLSWEEVECLGACVNAPMVMIFKDTYEDLTPERLAEIIDDFEAGKGHSVPVGPQNGRHFSAPVSGFTALADEKAILKSTRDKATKAAARTTKETPLVAAEPVKAAAVPPSNAAKPKTNAIETSPAVKTPSKVKAAPAAENATSVKAPKVKAEAKPAAVSAKAETAAAAPKKAPAKKEAAPAKPSLDHKNRPKGISKPAAVDDLKLISGVGPKIEATLHELGIFTYAQVASWKKAEREWVDGYLSFHGRIEREDWVKQAKALAKGGVEEYIRVFGKKPV
ncbi:NADH-quinone oxidoreductase subunit E [Mesorhizobium sp. NPDC059054]|uniref:NADH-quinone oxidoreductase subunit E n=1 Tax=Mesorhizobium sp. NPDC059054 TaxID=3346711 RepID=UPI0036A74B10